MSNRRRTGQAPGGALADLIEDIRADGLTRRQYEHAQLLLAFLRSGGGSSAGLVLQFADKVDGGSSPGARPGPSSGSGALDERVARLLRELRQHERELITRMVVSRELPRGSLADYGKARSSYKTNRTARAFAVGRVTALLDSFGELVEEWQLRKA